MSNIIVSVNNKNVTLNDQSFISSGGEGSVYKKSGIIYKVYHNIPQFDLKNKIKELSILTSKSNILNPIECLYFNNKPMGFTMKYADNTIAMAQVFTNSYRDRNNITNKEAVNLCMDLMETINYIHEKGVLIVDCNEFNFLVDKKTHEKSYCIDVDSYQTKSFPATALMPSIQDYSSKMFSEYSDWYSYAILACQILIGIHPFKGKYEDNRKMKLPERMQKNISIFNNKVSVPNVVRDIQNIPNDFRNWMEDEFEKGKRTKPPMLNVNIITKPKVKKVWSSSSNINKKVIEDIEVKRVEVVNGIPLYYTKDGLWYNHKLYKNVDAGDEVLIIENIPHSVRIYKGILQIINLQIMKNVVNNSVAVMKIQVINNTIYSLSIDNLNELGMLKVKDGYVVATKNSSNILPNATRFYKNCIYSDVMGIPYVYIPFVVGMRVLISLKEIKGHKIYDMKYENNFLQVITYEKGIYYEHFFRFDKDHKHYIYSYHENVTPVETNFAVLLNGIVVILDGDDNICITSIRDDSEKILSSVGLGDSKLFALNRICVFSDKVYEISMMS